ncbi:hypothetical protein BGAL_0071g00040 [Botrytis galanthina]|uniref:J domain-containing protein n=1 Tax=Botrytis galanthina TaxID=278940 RepID=A0A4V4HVC1_9HELO|nr:hypothetical protein BGAL_0071g00040 [Botrytis galanthina]
MSSIANLKRAYLFLHRDSNPTSNPSDFYARKRFVTEAYRTLGAPARREAYDKEHNLNQPEPEKLSNSPRLKNNPSAKFERKKSWDEDYGDRDDLSDDESYDGRRHVSFAESHGMPLRRDSHSSSDDEAPQRTHGVGRVPYRRFPQSLVKDRGRNSSYGDRPRHALSIRHYRSRSPPLESSSSDNDSRSHSPLRTSFRGRNTANPFIRKSTTYGFHTNPFAVRSPARPPSPRSEASFDDSRLPSPERGSLHQYNNQSAHSFAERASAPNSRPSKSPSRRAASVARPVTDSVNWRQRYEMNHKVPQPKNSSGAYNNWSRSRRIQPPSPQPSPRPTSYNFPSHQFLQEPVIPFDRRPAYYPDHYDGKSYNPYGASGTERADDDIVQQLLLEWTPASEEAEAAAAQNTDENNRSTANRDLNDTYAKSSGVKIQSRHTAQEQVERTDIPNATKMNIKGGRRPMATVEDDAGELSSFETPLLFPRRAMTNFF